MLRLDARASLGLVLALTGIRQLPQWMSLVVQWLSYEDIAWEMMPALVPLLMVVLQIAAGCTFAFGSRRAGWVLFFVYLGLSAGLVGLTFSNVTEELGILTTLGMLVETVGTPLVAFGVLLAGRPDGSSPRQELGAVLIVFAISSLVGVGLNVLAFLRSVVSDDVRLDQLRPLSDSALWWATSLTIATLQLVAGLKLRRGAERAQRAVTAYLITALIIEGLLLVLGVGFALLSGGFATTMLVGLRLASAAAGFGFPLLVWAFARTHPAPPIPTAVPMAPVWMAFLFVPFLIVRPLLTEELVAPIAGDGMARALSLGFLVLAVTTAMAVVAALRGRMSASGLAVAATLVGVILTVAIVVTLQTDGMRSPIQMGPFLQLTVALAVIAWLHRITESPVPRAVVKR